MRAPGGETPEWAAATAGLWRRFPLRWCDGDGGRSEAEIRSSGFLLGPGEALLLAAEACGREPDWWPTRHGTWPVFDHDGWLVVPGVPVASGRLAVEGMDGMYRRRGRDLVREAVGQERVLLSPQRPHAADGLRFDLMWFADNARCRLDGGELEIEDLFSRCTIPATTEILEQLLVRARRAPPELIEGLPLASGRRISEVVVGRPLRLMAAGATWRDPAAYFHARADVRSVAVTGQRVEIDTVDDRAVSFAVESRSDGWTARRRAGRYPFECIEARASDSALELRCVLAEDLDPLRNGLRGRLAFDLGSDLVILGRQKV